MRVPLALTLLSLLAAGCLQDAAVPAGVALPGEATPLPALVAHAAGGALLPLPSVVPAMLGATLEWGGAEPTVGVTSDGYIFMVAYERVLRSADGGATWDVVSTPVSSPTTLDPYIYVDPATDRVYSDQLYLGCSWLSWSDDRGATWTTNPAACGLPVNDHQKMVAAKNRGAVPTVGYENVLFYAYNAIAGGQSRVGISYDGGRTFPVTSVSFPGGACNGGLHGDIIADAEGTLYIPKRHCEGFILLKSTDSGLTWTNKLVGDDVGGSECRKNADLATDDALNVYGVWPGKDNRLYLSTSQDKGETWLAKSIDMSPPGVNMTTMPSIVAGSAGRIAAAYYGTADGARGPDEVAKDAQWHLYVTYSLDALSESPTFVTVRASEDPVQIGPISTNSACDAPPGSRNLLDFIGTA
ncbi:MAG TPA: sialidase family protein, partial [Candidatus Thermoplasmatota archaeon]|nr:sialidase family protein [Candidatus Thermoplasmatota archaeon]